VKLEAVLQDPEPLLLRNPLLGMEARTHKKKSSENGSQHARRNGQQADAPYPLINDWLRH